MRFLAWLGHFLTRHEDTPPVGVITRDYEWRELAWCDDCKYHRTMHLFIEWVESGAERVTTKECGVCGLETEVAREEAGPETVDH